MKNLLVMLAFSFLAVSCQKSFDEQCMETAREHTLKMCPQQVAEGVVMDSMVYSVSTRTMTYYNTLGSELNVENIIRNKAKLRSNMIENITASVELRQMKEREVVFCYVYRSAELKKEIIRIKIVPEDYTRN